jgi:hypothetical protein
VNTANSAARRSRLPTTLLCLALLPLLAWAQLYTGSVTGVVTDPSGARVPKARLRLVDEQKGFAFTAVSDFTGGYVIRKAPPGIYKLSVEAQGFRVETQSGIKLDVSQNVTVDLSLTTKRSQVSRSVDCAAEAGAARVAARRAETSSFQIVANCSLSETLMTRLVCWLRVSNHCQNPKFR